MAEKGQEKQAKQKRPFVPPVALVNAALRARRALLRAADAVVPSYVALLDRFFGAATTMAIHSAARLRIADLLKEGPLDAVTLAERTGSTVDALERTMRLLVAVGVFERRADGRFANNKTSSGLISGSDAGVRGFVDFFGHEPLIRSWLGIPARIRDGTTNFSGIHGRPVWEWMASERAVQEAFVEGMASMTEVIAPAIAAAYPWDEVRTVCDVGGGVGITLAAALRRHGHLRGMLFDSASMLGEAGAHLARHGVAERVTLHAGSFFEAIPRGADAYLLKTVLHNWDDADAVRILQQCRGAMEPGHRLVVADFLDEPDPISTLVPYMDIAGMMIFSGRERSPTAVARLFEQAGFRFGRTIPLPGCQAIFEGVAVA